MDRGRARSVSRSRSRRDTRRESMHSSHESLAGNLSPGRHHAHRRENAGGGFFKNLFGRRDKHPHQHDMQHPQHPGDASPLPNTSQTNTSPGDKFKAFFGRSPQAKRGASPPVGRNPAEELQLKELQHRVQLLTAQVEGYDKMKQQLQQEQRTAQEWKEKWNYQNFKLNLMVDMLVLRVLELEQPTGSQAR